LSKHFHHEKLPSALARYNKEIKRVSAVLDGVVKKNGGHLIGSETTYTDLAFVPWYWLVSYIDQTGALEKELHAEDPAWSKWINALNARPAVKKCFDARMKEMSG